MEQSSFSRASRRALYVCFNIKPPGVLGMPRLAAKVCWAQQSYISKPA